MDIKGYPWIPMDIHGYHWISEDIHGYPWMSINGCLWMSMDIYGYPWIWISMDIHRCPWISMGIHGYRRESMDINGYLKELWLFVKFGMPWLIPAVSRLYLMIGFMGNRTKGCFTESKEFCVCVRSKNGGAGASHVSVGTLSSPSKGFLENH